MNRMVVADGQLVSGAIVRGTQGEDITYDVAGRRRTQTKNAGLTGYASTWVWYPGHGPGSGGLEEPMEPGTNGDTQDVAVGYSGARQEQYTYRDDGELATVKFAETGYTDNGDGTVSSTGTLGTAVLRAQYDRDAAGRITEYQEFGTDGTTVTRDRYSIVYDARNNITSEYVSQVKVESGVPSTYLTHTTNNYTTYGLLTSVESDESKGGSDPAVPDTLMSYSYAWYDGARVSSTSFDGDTGTTSNTIFTSTYYYDTLGRVGSVDIADGRRRTVSFAYTPEGQVLSRKERSSASANPEDQHYFVAGAQYGELTNNGNYDPELQDYAQSLVMRNWTPNPAGAAFRWTASGGATNGIFGPAGYQALNPLGDGTASSDAGYIVRAGETLQSIAASVWGDASLWYLIADANGMSGGESLVAGASLILPDRVTNVHNNADTFRVYDPNRALGDLNPTSAKPPKKAGGCGTMGQILSIVVAVAAASVFGPILGNVVSQGFNNLAGLQHGFSWKSLALSTITAVITAGLDSSGVFSKIGSAFLRGAATGATANALTQGVAVATGLQNKFDWAGVAAAGVISGVGASLGKSLHVQSLSADNGLANHVNLTVASSAAALAGAATRSLISGTDFGDNVMAVLPDVIGSTIGNVLGYGISGWDTAVRAGAATTDTSQLLGIGSVRSLLGRLGDLIDGRPDGRFSVWNTVERVGGWVSGARASIAEGEEIVVNGGRYVSTELNRIFQRLSRAAPPIVGRAAITVLGGPIGMIVAPFVSNRTANTVGTTLIHDGDATVRSMIKLSYNMSSPGMANALLQDLGYRTYGPNANLLRPMATQALRLSAWQVTRTANPGLLIGDARAALSYASNQYQRVMSLSPAERQDVLVAGVTHIAFQAALLAATDGAAASLRGAEAIDLLPAAESGPEILQVGGAYNDVKGIAGYEAHHMPADSISPLSTGEGPSIAMPIEDHQLTASWGNSREARAYRQTQADLIGQGDFRGAQQMDINDISGKFGNRYDDAIQQMLRYSQGKGH